MPGVVDKGQVPGKQPLAALWLHDTFTFSHVTTSSLFIYNLCFPIQLENSNLFPFTPNRDSENCLRKTRFMTGEESHWAFVGDSRIRQLYFEVLKLLDPDAEPLVVAKDSNGNNLDMLVIDEPYRVSAITTDKETVDSRPLEKVHSSLTYKNSPFSLRMTFFWRPTFNQSAADLFHQLGLSKSVPNLVVAGSGAWDIKSSNGSQLVVDAYSRNLEQVAEVGPSK
jgi:hypothetical protein